MKILIKLNKKSKHKLAVIHLSSETKFVSEFKILHFDCEIFDINCFRIFYLIKNIFIQ